MNSALTPAAHRLPLLLCSDFALPLQHICEMYLQPLEDGSSYSEQHHCHNPEVHGGEEILKEPFPLTDSAAIAVYDID